jgi:hypothetical protein
VKFSSDVKYFVLVITSVGFVEFQHYMTVSTLGRTCLDAGTKGTVGK